MPYFKVLGLLNILCGGQKNTTKWDDGTIGGSVSIVLYAKFNGFSCAHKSLYTFYFCKSPCQSNSKRNGVSNSV